TSSTRDWSSDVCSSDLCAAFLPFLMTPAVRAHFTASAIGLSTIRKPPISWTSSCPALLGCATSSSPTLKTPELDASFEEGTAYRSEERRVGKERRFSDG